MSITIESYFKLNNLYDKEELLKKCEQEGVQIIESSKYPNLVMLHYDTRSVHFENKWTDFNKRCRGLIVDLKNEKILAYPFDKFFNLNEQPETNLDVLLELGDFEVAEKLDGSMIMIFKNPATGQYVATTKGSFDSEHGKYATSIIPDSVKNDKLNEDYTLMFELINEKFKIVVDYEKKGYNPGLYLIGARDRRSNKLLSFTEVRQFAEELNVGSPNIYTFKTLEDVVKKTRELSVLEEGYVVRFNKDGRLVKMKGDEYLQAHRFISCLSQKAILEALKDGSWETLLGYAPEEYRNDVYKDIKRFQEKKADLLNKCQSLFLEAPKNSRKEFALWVNNNVPSYLKGFLFTLFDRKPISDKKVYHIIGKMEVVTAKTKI